ncbi:MAG TPA: hypothetical protein VK141_11735 [Nitrosomonas sp.]|nr:hypothetical protein [Nitrosomonas sp.]
MVFPQSNAVGRISSFVLSLHAEMAVHDNEINQLPINCRPLPIMIFPKAHLKTTNYLTIRTNCLVAQYCFITDRMMCLGRCVPRISHVTSSVHQPVIAGFLL